jgi:hypothetical protein
MLFSYPTLQHNTSATCHKCSWLMLCERFTSSSFDSALLPKTSYTLIDCQHLRSCDRRLRRPGQLQPGGRLPALCPQDTVSQERALASGQPRGPAHQCKLRLPSGVPARLGSSDGISCWQAINAAFNWLPVGAVVADRILCIHGGIGQVCIKLLADI